MKISIVIPLYNVEQYVERCLYSCINQKEIQLGIDYEIICINDGSKDKSAEIAKSLINNIKGVIWVDQSNQGLSAARNKGLSLAKGEYVWFVDSDDWIERDSVCSILPLLSEDLDVVHIQSQNVNEVDSRIENNKIYSLPIQTKGIEIMIKGGYPTMAQLSIYRTNFLRSNKLWFYEGIYHEDAEFMPRVLYYAKSVKSLDKVLYNYLLRKSGSITADYKLKNGLDAIKVCVSLYNFSKDFSPELIIAYANRISQIVYTHLLCIKYLNEVDKNILFREMSANDFIYRYMLNASAFRYKILARILCLNVKVASALVRLDIR